MGSYRFDAPPGHTLLVGGDVHGPGDVVELEDHLAVDPYLTLVDGVEEAEEAQSYTSQDEPPDDAPQDEPEDKPEDDDSEEFESQDEPEPPARTGARKGYAR